jgi:hypothetical protein
MDTRIAQNALNFILSDRMTLKGSDVLPLVEIVNALQQEVQNGPTPNPQDGSDQTED